MSLSPENADDVPREIDSRIWRACAGASVQIPTLHSRVYYFPQGHVEHCCGLSSPLLSNLPSGYNPVPCVVSAIELLADPITDEVFAYLRLQPMSPDQFYPTRLPTFGSSLVEENNKVVTFAKILTPSDANNGGGFSVPRYCADSVFPQLNFDEDPPVQKLFITDIHGVVWDFRHIYRGTPRRHLLTTGWSKFVNNKKLISGDSVVFMRKSPHEMFMGVRRAPVSSTGGGTSFYGGDESSSYYNQNSGGAADEDDGVGKKVFRRIGKGKLTTGAVSEAINRAAKGQPFEVVYYPTAGWSEFVVRAEDVEASMTIFWAPGTRVKMAMETEDSSRITWFQGTVSSTYHETGPWRGSPWKQLQITWDEPEILQNVKRVNPWQVEVVAGANQLHPTLPPPKRMRYPPTGGFLNGEEGEIVYYERGQSSSAPPPEASPYLYSYTTFPAGMQGARHYEFGSFNSTRFIGENPPRLFTNNFFSPHPESGRVSTEMNSGRVSNEMNSGRVSTEMNSERVSTEMNSGRVSTEMNSGSSPSENLSPTSNNTNQSSGNELVGNRGPVAAKTNSFQLFGQIINVQEPSESGVAESVDVSKDSSGDESLTNTQLSL